MDEAAFLEITTSLQSFYRVELDAFQTKAFYKFVKGNFRGIAHFEAAAEGVMARVKGYGTFPIFNEFLAPIAPARNEQALLVLTPAPEETLHQAFIEVEIDPKWKPLHPDLIRGHERGILNRYICKIKAKVHVSQYLKRTNFLKEAIAEANARHIPLRLIDVNPDTLRPTVEPFKIWEAPLTNKVG
jgi:hypothetical protein